VRLGSSSSSRKEEEKQQQQPKGEADLAEGCLRDLKTFNSSHSSLLHMRSSDPGEVKKQLLL
jgi:hypothetical protein